MKKFAPVFLFTCLFIQIVYSQTAYKITGKVLDRYTRRPVIGASVQIVGTTQGAMVDDNGRFEINRLADEQTRLSQRDIEDTRIDSLGTPGWVTLNLKYHLEFNRVSFNLMLENIFDEKYKEHGSGIYSPGRGVVLTLRYDG